MYVYKALCASLYVSMRGQRPLLTDTLVSDEIALAVSICPCGIQCTENDLRWNEYNRTVAGSRHTGAQM